MSDQPALLPARRGFRLPRLALAENVLLALLYLAGGRGGLLLAYVDHSVTAIWPPAGIAVAVLLLGGDRFLPGIAVGAFLTTLSNGNGPGTALLVGAADTLGPWLGVVLLKRLAGDGIVDIRRLRDVSLLVVIAGLGAMLVDAAVGTVALILTAGLPAAGVPRVALTWWVGDASAVIIVAPLILAWWQVLPLHLPPPRRAAEALGLVGLAASVTAVAFGAGIALAYATVPVVLWGALRFRQTGATTAVVIVAVIDIAFTIHGFGQFGLYAPATSLLALQLFNAVVAVVGLVVGAVTARADAAQQDLRRAGEELEETVRHRTAELVASEARYRSVIAHANEVIFEAVNGRWTFLSPAWESVTGFGVHEALGTDVLEWVHPDDRAQWLERFATSQLPRDGDIVIEHRYRTHSGDDRWVRVTMQTSLDDHGIRRSTGVMEDITVAHSAEEALRARAVEMSAIALITHQLAAGQDIRRAACHAVLSVVSAQRAMLLEPDGAGNLRPTAVSDIDLPDVTIRIGIDPSGAATVFTTGQSLFIGDAATSTRVSPELTSLTGARSLYFEPLLSDDTVVGVLAVIWTEAVDEIRDRERQLVHIVAAETAVAVRREEMVRRLDESARTDPLTGLDNRRSWDEKVTIALASAARRGAPLSVAILDLDHFKTRNDTLGHQAGDALLIAVSAAWRQAIRAHDLLGRYGGDEFILALPDTDGATAMALLERLRRAVPDGQTVSVGVAEWRAGDAEPADAMRRADEALYEAKRSGRNRVILAAPGPVTPSISDAPE